MNAALIGLLGVVAGALLGGVVNQEVERRRRRARAGVAGRLIALELGVAARRIRSAQQSGQWWTGSLPSAEWDKHREDLALDMDPAVLDRLYDGYVIIDRRNADKAFTESGSLSSGRHGEPDHA